MFKSIPLKHIFFKICEKIDSKIFYPVLSRSRVKKLNNKSLTIISNNCWAGKCYEFFGLPKATPTVGGYFFAEEYVKFCKNLKYYLSLDLKLIDAKESKYYDVLLSKGEQNTIIGVLDDVEIVFLHYHDKKALQEKWQRRISRINWNAIVLKFSYQNMCTDDLIKEFLEIDEFPKFCLVGESITGHKDEIIFKRSNGKETVDEIQNFNWYVDPIKILNERS